MHLISRLTSKSLFLVIFLVGFSTTVNASEQINEHYFLPEEHPLALTLYQIFSSSRVLSSLKTMKDAGFISPQQRPKGLVIGVHPKLKGYLLKMYLDTFQIDAYAQWVKRIEGALLIKKAINNYGLQNMMCVPQKWIYVLPTEPSALQNEHLNAHQSILVVEDMKIVDKNENAHLYKSAITEEHLEALFKVLIECKLVDSVLIDNIPFTKRKKIAFIDTEISGRGLHIWWRVQRLEKYLSPEMQLYWQRLIHRRHCLINTGKIDITLHNINTHQPNNDSITNIYPLNPLNELTVNRRIS